MGRLGVSARRCAERGVASTLKGAPARRRRAVPPRRTPVRRPCPAGVVMGLPDPVGAERAGAAFGWFNESVIRKGEAR